MARLKKPDQKLRELRNTGTLNSHPAAVSDTLFRENPFFDSRDLLQVRYEMLRRHRVDGASDRGNRLGFWSFPPNFLSGGSCIRKGRPDGSGAQAARPQGGTQAVQPGDRTRADIEVFFSRPDDRRMRPSRAGEVWDYRSSPQPGKGDGGQKKTAQGELRLPLPATATEAYEVLRQHVVRPDGQTVHAEGRGVLIHCGLARWAQRQSFPTVVPPPGPRPWRDRSQPAVPPTGRRQNSSDSSLV